MLASLSMSAHAVALPSYPNHANTLSAHDSYKNCSLSTLSPFLLRSLNRNVLQCGKQELRKSSYNFVHGTAGVEEKQSAMARPRRLLRSVDASCVSS